MDYTRSVNAGLMKLLDAFKKLQYGKIFNAELKKEKDAKKIGLTKAQASFVDAIQDMPEGFTVKEITVHQGDPQYAKYDLQVEGFDAEKLLKFNS